MSPTLVNLVEDHGFVSEKYYLHWYEVFGEAVRAYTQSGEHHAIAESHDSNRRRSFND